MTMNMASSFGKLGCRGKEKEESGVRAGLPPSFPSLLPSLFSYFFKGKGICSWIQVKGQNPSCDESGSTRSRERSYLMEQGPEGIEFTIQVEGLSQCTGSATSTSWKVRVRMDIENR